MGSKRQRICYHGTDEENAWNILQTGFRAGTYFSLHLEDALGFGGEYIFEVAFPGDLEARDGWQFTIPEVVPLERIVALYRLEKTMIATDDALRHEVFEGNRDAAMARVRRTVGGRRRSY